MLHFRRYIAALALLLAVFGAYYAIVPPWLQPPPVHRGAAVAATGPVQVSPGVETELASLFAADAWERDPQTKVVETSQCILLVRDYLPTPDGRLELKPCTLVFYTGGESASGAPTAPKRPIILQAPAGAELIFDKPLEIGRGEFGQIVGGRLAGEITITSPPSHPGSDDALRIVTRDVQLNRDRVFAPYAVEFQYGQSSGRGSDLTFELLKKQSADGTRSESASFEGVRLLRLGHLERFRINTTGGQAGAAGPFAGGPNLGKDSGPVEVTCQGPFVFDFDQQLAVLDDRVEILRLVPGSAPDRLRCDKLLMEFARKRPDPSRPGIEQNGPPQVPAENPAAKEALAGRLHRVIAFGRPATLDAPSSAARAVACRMEYSLAQRRIVLVPGKESPQVSLRQAGNEFTTRELEYEFAATGQIGRLWAAGPGNLTATQERGESQQVLTARWSKELRIQPQGASRVISLTGEAAAGVESQGDFKADEIHLWVLETAKGPKTSITPDRLLATGNVRVESPQLIAKTARLEAWFANHPAGEAAAAVAGPEKMSPFPSPLARDESRPPSPQQFKVLGDLIQMRVLLRGKTADLEDLTIRGHATIDETHTPEPGQEPIHIAGELLTLRGGSTPQAKIEVTGQPAELGGRGMALIGGKLNVHRGENRAWIDGPGEATLPVPEGDSFSAIPLGNAVAPVREPGLPGPVRPRQPAAPPKKMHVVWTEGLNFDGQKIRLTGEIDARQVDARGNSHRVRCPTLELTLSHPLDMSDTSRPAPLEVGRLHLAGGVYLENHGVDERGERLSHDQFKAQSLTVDRQSGRLEADGPGWVSSVRRGVSGIPGVAGQSPAAAPLPGIGPQGAALTSIHIQFEQQIEGRLAERTIEFQRKVRTTYSPAKDFDDLIVARSPADLGEQGILMTSDKLALTEMQAGGQKWLEMEAKENVVVEGNKFTVRAATVRYTSDKEMLTIEGNGRTDAELWYQAFPGQPRTYTSARKLRYWIRDGEFDGEDFNMLDLQQLSPRLKMPGRRR